MAYYEDIIYDDNGKTKCNLCKIEVNDSNFCIDLHIKESNHINLYLNRLMIKNNIVASGNEKHCIICKMNIQMNIDSHIQSFEHQSKIENIKDLVEKDGHFLELPQNITETGSSVYCGICNTLAEFTLKGIKNHTSFTHHKRACALTLQYYNGIFSVEGTNDELWCKICRVYLENYIEVIFKHIDEDREHIKRIQKIKKLIEGQNITIENFLTVGVEDKAYCNKCNTGVSCNVDNLERHIKGRTHNH